MEDQLGALGLVLNCITLWNTVYMDAALEQLRAEDYPVREEDLAYLSPFVRKHINVNGHYSFLLPDMPGGRRELRDPDEPLEDEGDWQGKRCVPPLQGRALGCAHAGARQAGRSGAVRGLRRVCPATEETVRPS